MKKLALSLLIATSLIGAPGVFVATSGALAQQGCGPDAPPEYFRPGGFCALSSGKSLHDLNTGAEVVCPPPLDISDVVLPVGARVRVADLSSERWDRLLVADVCDEIVYEVIELEAIED